MKFRDLQICQSFDFISGDRDSFFDTCIRISARKYVSINTGLTHKVGTINCAVYHAGKMNRRP
jgi:hypothetical protein